MNELMIFEGNNVEVFNWEDKVLGYVNFMVKSK